MQSKKAELNVSLKSKFFMPYFMRSEILFNLLFYLRNILHNGLLSDQNSPFIPLRGALVIGEMILQNRIYLGKPIIDADEWEKFQKWIGISIHPKYISDIRKNHENDFQRCVGANFLMEWDVPTKYGLVKTWAINMVTSQSHSKHILTNLKNYQQGLNETIQPKYTSTIRFIEYITDNQLWSPVR